MMIYKEFSFLLQKRFMFDQDKHNIDAVRGKMGIARTTFYNWVEGNSNFPMDMLAPLYNATKDPAFLNFAIQHTDQKLTPREIASVKTVQEEAFDFVGVSGALIAFIQQAKQSGGYINKSERQVTLNLIHSARKELDELEESVKKDHR